MELLHHKLKKDVKDWRDNNYKCNISEVKEILEYQIVDYQFNNKEKLITSLRYLRKPQFEALETYCYLRFVKHTKHIIELYREYYKNPNDLLQVLGVNLNQRDLVDILYIGGGGIDQLFKKIKTDNEFVKKYKLENLKETLSLNYPSYILSLVMGSGKTILIAAIIFIEFSLSLITKNNQFLKNILVFAPGKTILGSLREISFIALNKLLPKRFASILQINLKITYTQDGQKSIPIIEKSDYNVIITNIEKIRITTAKKGKPFFNKSKIINQEERKNIVNFRLQQLASLKNLGVFSDEAHNTYGQQLEREIKKVRQTINYLAEKTNLEIVINTTGTPYFKNRCLKMLFFGMDLLKELKKIF